MLIAALVWVATQAIMAGLPFLPSVAVAADGSQTIVICSGNGIETITLNADGNPIETLSQSQDCPWCAQIGGVGQVGGPGGNPAAHTGLLLGGPACRSETLVLETSSTGGFHSRAPPVFASL